MAYNAGTGKDTTRSSANLSVRKDLNWRGGKRIPRHREKTMTHWKDGGLVAEVDLSPGTRRIKVDKTKHTRQRALN